MKKRLISALLAIAMLASLLPTAFAADTVTRAEWISQLVEAFSMTVEDDSTMPDNYFSDITESDSYYRDILLAVEFGVIDLEAGEAFEPNEPATREFAARTLNSCLQFQLDEGAEYTFSEADSVTYPDDIQVAINRNWFALSGGNFLPEQAITAAEATAMIADAQAVTANDGIDENYNSTYEFAEGVIVIPETTEVTIDENNTVTITDSPAEINTGDIFVVYKYNYPIVLKAEDVETIDNTTVISATNDGTENAVLSVDSQGSIDIDLEDFHFDELTTYSITNTETGQNEEMEIQLYGISYDKVSKTLTASKKISIGDATAGNVTVKMTNFKVDHKENTISGNYETTLTADTNVTASAEFDLGKYTGIPSSLVLGTADVGLATVTLSVDYSLKGGITMSWDGILTSGYVKDSNGFRLKADFSKKSFDFTAKAELEVGLRLQASLDLIAVKGNVYATVGVDMSAELKSFDSGTPSTCITIKGYLFANVGASVTFRYLIGEKSYSKSKTIFNEYNSPVRAVYHYEDGKLVNSCSRGQSLKYTTSYNSRYFNPYGGQGSYGGGEDAEPVVIWEYTTDDDGNATITKYNGNASALAIPSELDGHKVVKIGGSVFSGKTFLRSVTIPNSVTYIDNYAFRGCSNLSSVTLSKKLEIIGSYVFSDCDALMEIEIPKSLSDVTEPANSNGGPFDNSGLKTVTFEDGTTQVIANLFYGANNLENVTLLDTMTSIGWKSFENCTLLSNIDFPDSITKIDASAFAGCKSLTEISMPDSITQIGNYSFCNCNKLSKVILPKYLDILGHSVFTGCNDLTEINIPKTLSDITEPANSNGGPFDNSGLKTVTFEDGTTQVIANLFYGANNLENVTLLDTMTSIGWKSFENCTSLKEISIPDSVTGISTTVFSGCTSLEKVKLPSTRDWIMENMFYNCKSLKSIELPETVVKICKNAFNGCSSLENIELPSSINIIEDSAFYECSSLEKVNIPDSVTSIGSSAFYNCDALTAVETNMRGSIGSKAFYDCDALTTLTLGDGVTSIGSELCYGCDNLSEVKLGKYITTIPDSAFRLCQSLTSITLPRFCTTVAANAFAEDTKLTSAYVPVAVSSIQTNSFSYPAKMTMYGKSGSYAEEYANSRNMTFNATNAPITSIDYTDNSVDIARYAKIRPTLNIEPEFDTSVITFASSDENILTVSETGEIYGKNYGTATVTATSDSGVKDAITVNVVLLADSVSLDKTELELESGDTAKLNATLNPSDATDTITWKSSNENVATVNNGTVTAVGAGTAVITVTTTGGKTASCTVKVIGTFTVTAAAGENGKISPSGDVAVKSNEKKTFNILPDYGYVVKDVLVNGASVGAVESYIFSNLTDNAAITAEFAKVDVAYENGTVTISSDAALKDLKLIVATYDVDGRLTDCEIKTVTANAGESYQDTVAAAENIKLMLWSGLDTMRPIWSNK